MLLVTFTILTLQLHSVASSKSVGLIGSLERQKSEEWGTADGALQGTHLWVACSYHFSNSRVLSVVILESTSHTFNSYVKHVMSRVNELLTIPIILTMGHPKLQKEYTSTREHSHLLIAPNCSSLTLYLEMSKKEYPQNTWRPQENFLILIMFTNNDITSNHNIFDFLWNEHGILNVLILINSLAKEHAEYIFAYDPFRVESLDRKTLMWVVEPEKLQELPKTYSDRISNLHGHTLQISMFTDRPTAVVAYDNLTDKWISKGRDGQVLNIIAKYMNFTPVIVPPENNERIGYKKRNGNFTGAMADLINRRTDIAVNEIYLKYYGTEEIQFTMPAIRHQEIVVLVPKSVQIHVWIVVYKSLKYIHWQYMLISFLSGVIVWCLLRRFDVTKDPNKRHEVFLFTNIPDMLAIFINMPLSSLTKIKSSPQRLLLSSCLIFSWFVMCNFQGLLLDIVTNSHFGMDIDTLQQLDEAGLSIFTENPNLMDTFNESESMEHLRGKLAYESDVLSVISQMKKYKNTSLVCSRKKATWFMKRYGESILHIINEAPRAYFMSYMVPKGSPYLERLHVLFGRITQAGLVDKWDEDAKYETQLGTDPEDDASDVEIDQKSLKLSDVAGNFMILTVGLVACIAVFLAELCV